MLERTVLPLLPASLLSKLSSPAAGQHQQNDGADGLAKPTRERLEETWRRLEEMFRRIAAAVLRWILATFSSFQDSLLALASFRSLVVWATEPAVTSALLRCAVLRPSELPHSFETSPYYVSDDTRQLLTHAAAHALAWRAEEHGRYTARLPAVGRILLQAPGACAGSKFQEACASALAKEVGASLMVADETLLSAVARAALGPGKDSAELDDLPGVGPGSLLALLLSVWLSGGRLQLVWELLAVAAGKVQGPLVLFIRDVEGVVCGSYERYDAFGATFGGRSRQPMASRPGLVLIGGCSLGETGTQLTHAASGGGNGGGGGGSSQAGGGETGRTSPSVGSGGGTDDAVSALLDLAVGSGGGGGAAPSARRALARLFATRVPLHAPPAGGPAAARHHAQLASDASRQVSEDNCRRLKFLAADRGLRVPGPECEAYCTRPMHEADWAKVLAWAVPMEMLIRQQRGAATEGSSPGSGAAAAPGAAASGGSGGSDALPPPGAAAGSSGEDADSANEVLGAVGGRGLGSRAVCDGAADGVGLRMPAARTAAPAAAAAAVSEEEAKNALEEQGAQAAAGGGGGGGGRSSRGSEDGGSERSDITDDGVSGEEDEETSPLLAVSRQGCGAAGGLASERGAGCQPAGTSCLLPSAAGSIGGGGSRRGGCMPSSDNDDTSNDDSAHLQDDMAPEAPGGQGHGTRRMASAQGLLEASPNGHGAGAAGGPHGGHHAQAAGGHAKGSGGGSAGGGGGSPSSAGGGGGGPNVGKEVVLKARLVRSGSGGNAADIIAGGSGTNGGGNGQGARRAPLVSLSEESLWYGLRMLERAGGGVRTSVRAENAYERRLLAEVVAPGEAGCGFSEVGALDSAKQALREAVQLPLQFPHLFARGSLARPCKGVLLFGPPGTGKTLLARAAAAECGASFLSVSPSSVASKWLGDGVRYVRAVFALAHKLSPCVVFVDEVDALLGRRKQSEHEALREMKNEFMAQWEGMRPAAGAATGGAGHNGAGRVMVLGATNRPQDLDDAVLRRFSRRVFCGLPNQAARVEVLKVVLAAERLEDQEEAGKGREEQQGQGGGGGGDVREGVGSKGGGGGDASGSKGAKGIVQRLAAATSGYSGSDLRQLATAAAMRPVRELLAAHAKPAAAVVGGKQGGKAGGAKRAAAAATAAVSEGKVSASAPEGRAAEAVGQPTPGPGQQPVTPAAEEEQQQPQPAAATAAAAPVASQEPQQQPAATAAATAAATPATSTAIAQPEAAAAAAPPVAGETVIAVAAGPEGARPPEGQPQLPLARLLDECRSLAGGSRAAAELRPLRWSDFEAALKEVPPSVGEDSPLLAELEAWNVQFGDGANRNASPKQLAYFM